MTKARQQWPNRDPIGQTVAFGNMDGNLKPLTIVGIVGDVRAEGLDRPASSVIYANYEQRGLSGNSSPIILLRTDARTGPIVAALALAAVGLYGVVAFSVTRRTQEIGIRMYLGAQRGEILRLVLGEGARMAVFGVVIGIAASFVILRLGISATDPLTFVIVAALLSAVALLASYIPARRAMRVDPMAALRHE